MRFADRKCKVTEVYTPEHVYTFTGNCIITGQEYSVSVPAKELFDYRHTGKLIQDCLVSLNADDRDFLMTGISPRGQEIIPEELEDDPKPTPIDNQVCELCQAIVWFSAHCGAWVCECGHHNGLARCYCGWSKSGGNGRRELADMGEKIDPEPTPGQPEIDYYEGRQMLGLDD